MARTTILEIPLEKLTTAPLDLSLYATPCRFRFLDCDSFINSKLLRIFEFDTLPSYEYSAISYPWLGLPASNLGPSECLIVKGAEAADPIVLSVLASACKAALSFDSEMLWLDRLSILQTNKADKSWQIQNMHSVYKDCEICLVLPGGLTRLASVSDETTWIERGWTLQEAFVPLCVYVLIQWDKGNEHISSPVSASITEIERAHSAVVELSSLLSSSYTRGFRIGTDSTGEGSSSLRTQPGDLYENIGVNCFESSHAAVLKSLISSNNHAIKGRDQKSRPAVLLSNRELSGVWRSSFMRTSSRPVDMVFSIMGIFGVALDVSKFHADDRIGATIALMQGAIKNGRGADWFSISMYIPPCRTISTMPMFPTTTVAGKPVVRYGLSEVKVSDTIGHDIDWYIGGVPSGSVDDSGAFRFSAKSVAIAKHETQGPGAKRLRVESGEKILWRFDIREEWEFDIWRGRVQDARYYAIKIGERIANYWLVSNGGTYEYFSSVLMFVERYSSEPEMFRRIGMGFISPPEVDKDWVKREFIVGGQGL